MAASYRNEHVIVGPHRVVTDWLGQRVTAVLMAAFAIVVLVRLLMPGEFGYARWVGIFSAPWMKALTCLAGLALLWHAWMGVRDILMDYVKPNGMRQLLQAASTAWLLGCVGWLVWVLWRL